MRWCWNWQTGMVEGHVPQGVWVQLPPSAQTRSYADMVSSAFFLLNPAMMISIVLGGTKASQLTSDYLYALPSAKRRKAVGSA